MSEDRDYVEAEVVPHGGAKSMLPATLESENAVVTAETLAKTLRKVRAASLAVTDPADWDDLGGRPYLRESGCFKVAPIWGIDLHIISVEPPFLEIDSAVREGRPITVMVLGNGRCQKTGAFSEFVGTRRSDDPFFAKQKDLNAGHLIKAARANFAGNAIRSLVGIKNISWADLKPFGITPGGAGSKVTYEEKKQGNQGAPPAGGQGGQKQASQNKGPTQKQVNFLKRLITDYYNGDKDLAKKAYDAWMQCLEADQIPITSAIVSEQIQKLNPKDQDGNQKDVDFSLFETALEAVATKNSGGEPPQDNGPPPEAYDDEPGQGNLL